VVCSLAVVPAHASLINITTSITVNIDFQGMSSGLGQKSKFFGTISYDRYLAALQAHSSGDSTDTLALASLPVGPNNPNGTTSVDVNRPIRL
jgi:hypothetical protein